MPNTFQLVLGFSGFMSLVMAVILYVLHRTYPSTIRGLQYWSLAAIVWAFSFSFFLGRGIWPVFITFILANTFLVTGFTFFLLGTTQFLDQQAKSVVVFFGLLNAAVFLILSWYVYVDTQFIVRASTMVSAILLVLAAILYYLIQFGQRGFAWGYIVFVLLLVFIMWFVRLFVILRGGITENFQEIANMHQVLFVVTTPIATEMGLLGCIMLASEKLREQLERKSRYDSLTNCLARASILEEIQKEILRSVRQKSYFAVMMLDLDNFKIINDTLGHSHGDRILIDFSNRVTETIRQIDRLGRLGGDEFIVLLPETTEKAARAVAERIQAAGDRGDHLSWQASVGIAVWEGSSDKLEDLLERADRALYQSKAERSAT